MIYQVGTTSFDACLNEVGISSGTEYGLEELFTYLNTYNSMTVPYYEDRSTTPPDYYGKHSMYDLRGFIGITGNSHYETYRYITCANVWHYMEIEDAWVDWIPPGGDYPGYYEWGITVVNRAVQPVGDISTFSMRGTLDMELWARPAGAYAIVTSSLNITLTRSVIQLEIPPFNIIDSVAYKKLNIGMLGGYAGYTMKWRWASSLPWNEVLI